MKMFSDCSGGCLDCVIHYYGGCLAGHGDDDFLKVNKNKATEFLNNGTRPTGERLSDTEIQALTKIAKEG